MARTVAEIQAQMIAEMAATDDLSYVDTNNITRNITYNTSKRAIWRLLTFIVAGAIAIFEQLQDLFTQNIETIVSKSAAASQLWIQAKMFEFQYDANNPQIVQLINTVPQYPVVDETKRIITACAVPSSTVAGEVSIKVAKSNPFEALSTLELNAAQSYIDTIGDAGISYTVISLSADKIYIDADIYYKGMYSAVISANVITAINTFLLNLSKTNFDGSLKMSDLEQTIRNVTGVNDVVLKNVRGRADATPFSGGQYLIQNTAVTQRQWNTVAGYIVEETDTGHTFTDSLNFIAQ